jgi:predicted nucleotidyltransferase
LLILTVLAAFAGGRNASAATLTWPQSNPALPCFGVGLQTCIGIAHAGDIVQVATNSPVNEDLTVDKSLTLRAATGFTPVLGALHYIFLSNPALTANVVTLRDFTLEQGRIFAVQTSLSTFNVTLTNLDILNTFNLGPEIQVRTGQPGPYGPIVFDISNNDLTIPANSQFNGAEAISIEGSNAQNVTGVIRNNRIFNFDGGQQGAIGLYNWLANPFDIDVIANEIRGADYNYGVLLFQFGAGNSVVRYLDNLVVGQVNVAGAPGAYVVNISDGTANFEITNNTAASGGIGVLVSGRDDLGASWSGSVANNIVSGMTGAGITISQPTQTSGNVDNDHNLVFNAAFNDFTPGPGTLFVNPLFVGGANYRLTDPSPARNSGNPARVPADLVTDLDGNLRQLDTVDMGAYESTTPLPACFTDIGAGLPGVSGFGQAPPSSWGDYDNDGDLDILLTGFTGSTGITRVYRSSGGPNPTYSDINAGLASGFDVAPAWGDYDKDGDLDIVLARGNSSLLYRNSGGPNPTFSDAGAGLSAAEQGAVAWGDYDKDGDLDLLLAGNDAMLTPRSRVYRNNGGPNPTFTQITGIALTGVSSASVAWGDYDNDRDLDILLAGQDDTGIATVTKLYRNNGAVSPAFTEVSAGLAGVRSGWVAWGDYDSDSDLDIFLAGNSFLLGDISKVYRNNGDGTFTDIGAALPGVNQSSGAWGDYDNDGDLDILLTGLSGASRLTRLCQNSGGTNPTFFEASAVQFAVGTGSVAWGDADNDGDLDILLTGYDGTSSVARVYMSSCAPLANTPPASPTNLTTSAGTAAALGWSAPSDAETPSAALSYNLRVGTTPGGSDIVSPMADPATGFRRVAALGYTNQNTSWEVMLPGPGTYHWSVQAVDGAFAGSAWASEQTVTVPLCFEDIGAGLAGVWASLVAWADYDNDGDLDALISGLGSTSEATTLYRNSGGPNPTFSDAGAGLPATAAGTVAWGDYDNDSDVDILFTSSSNTGVYRNSGGANPTFTDIGAGLPPLYGSAAAWGDFDNDNDLDILLTGEDESFVKLARLYRNTGGPDPTFTNYPVGGLIPVSDGSVAWGDYDGDNDIDILLMGLDAGNVRIVRILRNNGGANPTFVNMGAVNLPAVSRSSVAWGDFDNDGDLDILLTGYTGSEGITRVYRNSGTPSTPAFTDIVAGLPGASLSGNSGCVAWGDYDKDGRLDILLTGANMGRVYRNTGGNPPFTDIGAFLRPVQGSSAAWGDYDNDGDLDVLHTGFSFATSPSGPSAQVYRNLCAPSSKPVIAWGTVFKSLDGRNTPPSAPANLHAWNDGRLARFQWDAAQDAQTPSPAISYNLRVGTAPGTSDVVSPMADVSTGFRRVPSLLGNVGQSTTWEIYLPEPGTYYWSVQAVDGSSVGSEFAVEEIPVDVVEEGAERVGHTLSISGSNPFSSSTTIEFSQPASGRVSLVVYDLAGRRVRTLLDDARPAGRSKTGWDGKDEAGRPVASGVYFVRMKTADVVRSHKISLVR